MSASLGLSPNLSFIWLCLSPWLGCRVRLAGLVSQFVSLLALSFTLAGVLCPPRWACLPICLPPGFVFHLGWGAVSASLGLSPNLSPIWLCLSAWLGCCVRLAGLVSGLVSQFVSHLALSFTLAGVLCPPRWACLQICLPVFSPHLFPIWLCLSPWLGCCVRLAGLVSGLVSQFVSHLALSFALAGVLCPPRWACLRICLPPGFVFHLGWGAVSASLGLSPNLSFIWLCLSPWLGCRVRLAGLVSNLSPIWLCLSPWLGCCVRLAGLVSGLVSQFVSHLALSFTLAGVLCPPRWACLPICLPSGFVFHLGWGAVSASLGLSPNLSPSVLSPFVSHLALSFTLAGVLCPPRWACLPICLPSGFVFHLGWGAVSASLGLSPNLSPSVLSPSPWLGLSPVLSPNLSPTWLCLLRWLGCCVRLAFTLAGVLCPPRWACLLIPQTVYGWVSQCFLSVSALTGMLCPPRWACLPICLPPCLPSGLGCCVRLAGLVFLLSAVLSAILAGMLCPPRWAVSGLVSQLVSHLVWPGLVFLLSLVLSPSFCLCFVS